MNPFAPIYEFFENFIGIFDINFTMVFQTLYDKGGYNNMGILLLFIPLIFLLLFYLVWKYPYATLWHWVLNICIIALIVGVSTYSTVRLTLAKFIVSPNPDVSDFTEFLVLKYAVLNAFLSLLISFLYSLILRKKSKVQMHLPY